MIIGTYTPHKVKLPEGIDVGFPETGCNYPQPRFIITGESINLIPQAEFTSPTELITSRNLISSPTKFVPPDRQVYQQNIISPPPGFGPRRVYFQASSSRRNIYNSPAIIRDLFSQTWAYPDSISHEHTSWHMHTWHIQHNLIYFENIISPCISCITYN